MASFEKLILSGSSDGRAIIISATATSGTTLHTGPSDVNTLDEIWLYAQNTDTSDRNLTIEWGNTSTPDDLIELGVPFKSGLLLVVPGLLIKGNASPLIVRAFAESADVITIHGYVNRIS